MIPKLKIIGLNLDIQWKNPSANFETIEEKLSDCSADIFLLPEMFPTGFGMDASEMADRHEESLQWMKSFSQSKNAAVAGSAAVQDGEKFYNRFYFVTPEGTVEFYDKRHLFGLGGEAKTFSAGTERKIVEYKGWRILLQVCYDLRFPVFSRNTGDYDAVFYVANWPQSRIVAWETLLKARSIENQAYVFGQNRIGTDGNQLFYPESSACYFPDGAVVSEKSGDLVVAELDWERLSDFRKKFNFLQDGDRFQLL